MKVTTKAMRPASKGVCCFYCGQGVGEDHKPECVMIQKKVKVRMVVEYFASVPAHWDKHMIEFHRNESSWCASNALDELNKLDCICQNTNFEYLGEDSEPYLDE